MANHKETKNGILGGRNSKFKGPEVGVCLVCLRNSAKAGGMARRKS